MKINSAKVTGMTLAVTNMEKMVDFYKNVFEIDFEETEMYGSKLFKTQFADLEVLFCPASIAQNTAKQNRHQLNFEIKNIEMMLSKVTASGGEIMGDTQDDGFYIQVGIKDPDNNSLVLMEKVKN